MSELLSHTCIFHSSQDMLAQMHKEIHVFRYVWWYTLNLGRGVGRIVSSKSSSMLQVLWGQIWTCETFLYHPLLTTEEKETQRLKQREKREGRKNEKRKEEKKENKSKNKCVPVQRNIILKFHRLLVLRIKGRCRNKTTTQTQI